METTAKKNKKTASVTQKQFEALVREAVGQALNEAAIKDDLIPGADGKLAKYASRVEKFIEDTATEAMKLADEGDEMRQPSSNLEGAVEKNEFLKTIVGKLRQVRNLTAAMPLDLKQKLGG